MEIAFCCWGNLLREGGKENGIEKTYYEKNLLPARAFLTFRGSASCAHNNYKWLCALFLTSPNPALVKLATRPIAKNISPRKMQLSLQIQRFSKEDKAL